MSLEDQNELLNELESMAEDNKTVMFNLANYYIGIQHPEKYEKAILWLEHLSKSNGEGCMKSGDSPFQCFSIIDEKNDVCLMSREEFPYQVSNYLVHTYSSNSKCGKHFLRLAKEVADTGSSISQYNLAIVYYDGKCVEKNLNESLIWAEKSALEGYEQSYGIYGELLYLGYGGEEKKINGIEYLYLSAKTSDSKSLDVLIESCFSENLDQNIEEAACDYYNKLLDNETNLTCGANQKAANFCINKNLYNKKCFNLIQELAFEGEAVAQHNMGSMYYNGHGVKKNATKALEWWDKAAHNGQHLSQHSLGALFYSGEIGPCYPELSVFWLNESAKQGYAYSQYLLSEIYHMGLMVSQNIALSNQLLEKAAKSGHVKAQYYYGMSIIFQEDIRGKAEEAEPVGKIYRQDITRGIEFLEKACEGNYSNALHHLAMIQLKINYGYKDVSIDYLRRADELGNQFATSALAEILWELDGKDRMESIHYFIKSAIGGNEQSKKFLLDIMHDSEECAQGVEDELFNQHTILFFNIETGLRHIYKHTTEHLTKNSDLVCINEAHGVKLSIPCYFGKLSNVSVILDDSGAILSVPVVPNKYITDQDIKYLANLENNSFILTAEKSGNNCPGFDSPNDNDMELSGDIDDPVEGFS